MNYPNKDQSTAIPPTLSTEIVVKTIPERKNVAAEMLKTAIISISALTAVLLGTRVSKTLWTKKTASLKLENYEKTMLALLPIETAAYTLYEGYNAAKNNKKADELEKQQVEAIKKQGKIYAKQLEQVKLSSSQAPPGQSR
jgi:TRAP-type C4-dicarboxylate transport system permease small subunit